MAAHIAAPQKATVRIVAEFFCGDRRRCRNGRPNRRSAGFCIPIPWLYRNNPVEPLIEAAIDRLWDDIVTFRAIISDPALRNVVVTGDATDGYHLTLVDGLGERTAIPIQSWSKRAHSAQCKISRNAMKRAYRAQAQRP